MTLTTSEDITIRTATPDDFEDIMTVWRESGLSIRPQGRDRQDAFNMQLARFPDTFLVAETNSRMIGVVLGTHDERKGWINRLAVVPEFRGRGIAVSLVQACEKALQASGIGIIAALVEPHNEPSASLFRKLDYTTDVPVIYFRKLCSPDV